MSSNLQWLKDEFLPIEDNRAYSADEKILRVIHVTACICGVVAMQPLPFADVFALTPIQICMGYKIGQIRGVDITEQNATQIFKDVGGAIGLGFAGQQTAIGLYKLGLPFLGGFMTFPLVAGLTMGIGKAMDLYFRYRAEGRTLSPEQLKKIFNEGKEEGKRIDQNEAHSIVTAIPDQLEPKPSSRTLVREMLADQIYSSQLFSAKLIEATDKIATLNEEVRQLRIESNRNISSIEELGKELRVEFTALEAEGKQNRIEGDKRAAAVEELAKQLRLELMQKMTVLEAEQTHLKHRQRRVLAFSIATVLIAISTVVMFLRVFR